MTRAADGGIRISVFAGPSGGHLFPALAFLEEFRRQYPDSKISLVTSRRARGLVESSFPAGLNIEFFYLPEFPSAGGISWAALLFFLRLGRAFILTSRYLSDFRPDFCAGFGSFVSYPGVWLAARRGIRTLIHEQNVVPGKATRWLLKSADCVAVSFDETLAKEGLKRREVTGLPVREVICRRAAQNQRPASPGTFNLLVVGGSQGALKLNRLILEAISGLSPEEKAQIAVIHITGTQDLDFVTQGYLELGVRHRTHAFYGAMQDLYAEADMAVTRAGANTLFELALFGIPAMVIPYPYAGAHQNDNARYFESRGSALTSQQSELTGTKLRDVIRSMMRDNHRLKQLSGLIRKLAAPQAAVRLVQLAGTLMKQSRPNGPQTIVQERQHASAPQA